MVENLFRGHPSGEHPLHRNPFLIRVIREIRGFSVADALPITKKPRITRITRMGTGFVTVENLFRGHPTGVHPLHRKPFFIRENP